MPLRSEHDVYVAESMCVNVICISACFYKVVTYIIIYEYILILNSPNIILLIKSYSEILMFNITYKRNSRNLIYLIKALYILLIKSYNEILMFNITYKRNSSNLINEKLFYLKYEKNPNKF